MEKFNKTMSAKGILRDREKFNFDSVIQRGHVWNLKKRSLLIHSMLVDYPIPAVFAQDGEDGRLNVIDGKQRLTSIIRFLNDEFALTEDIPNFKGEKLAGKKFSELDERTQDRIKDYSILIYYFRSMTNEERDEMFKRLNFGQPMSRIEITRVEAGEEFMNYIRDIAKNSFFQNCNISDSARNKFTDEEILLQCVLMLVEDGVNGLSGGALSETVSLIKKQGLTIEEKHNINETIEYLNIAFLEKTKFLKKVNIPIIFYMALQNREDIHPSDFAYMMQEFFKSPTEEYKTACSSGSAKPENVAARIEELQNYIDSKQAKKEDKEQWENEEEGEEEIIEVNEAEELKENVA